MVIKIGSKGELVKILQTFLGITADGNFGPKTEAAVKAWQAKNGLIADGIVGPKTQNAMGLLDTDQKEKYESGELNITQYFLRKGEYYAGPVKKSWIFLHHTAGWHNPNGTVDSWNADNRGPVATEFILGGPSIRGNDNSHDGSLVQAFPRGGYGWHLGTGNDSMHRESVGIELCNFGQLTKGGWNRWDIVNKRNIWIAGKPDSFYTYVGTEAHPSQIIELSESFRGFKFWHKYSDKQVEVLKNWIIYIGNRDNIDIRKGIVEQIKKHGAKAFDMVDISLCNKTPGLWLHTNVQRGKVDLFPQPNVIEMLLSL
jgi:hypothetical protein